MKKQLINCVDKAVSKVLHVNMNSTTSFTAYQPKLPKDAKYFAKKENK